MQEDRYFDNSKQSFSDGEIPEEERGIPAAEENPSSGRRLSLFLVIGVSLLIVLMIITWFRQDPVDSAGGNRIETIEGRMQDLEARLDEFQAAAERLVQIDYQNKELVSLIQKMEQTNRSLSERMDIIAQELVALQRRLPAKAPVQTAKPESAAGERKEAPAGVRHEVQSGDTLYSISRRYGISIEELRRLNRLGEDNTIRPGQELIVTPNDAP
jgi:LysM repeat protein